MLRQLAWLLLCMCLLQSCRSETSPAATAQSAGAPHTKEAQAPLATSLVEIRNGPISGSLELVAHGVIELNAELIVERQLSDGSFEQLQNLDLGSIKLVTSCEQRLSQCIRLDERGLLPLPWSGMSCSSQCNHSCDKNVRLEGRFRFVVNSCDGKSRFESPIFELRR